MRPGLRRPEKIRLRQRHAIVAQYVVSGGHVKKEVRQRETLEIFEPREIDLAASELPDDRPVFGTIEIGDWKLMEFFEDGRLELYNLRDDIGESKNLAQQQPDKARELHARLVAWRTEIKAPMPTPHTPDPTATAAKPKAKKGKGKKAQAKE